MLRRCLRSSRCVRHTSTTNKSALDFTPFQVPQSLSGTGPTSAPPRTSSSHFSVNLSSSYDRSSSHFNLFMSSISGDDLMLSLGMLDKLKNTKTSSGERSLDHFESVYYQSVSILFFHLITNRKHDLNIRTVMNCIDGIIKDSSFKQMCITEKSLDMKTLKANILRSLLLCYHNLDLNTTLSQNIEAFQQDIIKYSLKVFKVMSIRVEELTEVLESREVEDFCRVFNYNSENTSTKKFNGSSKKDGASHSSSFNHLMTFDKLTELIGTRFERDTGSELPLYEYYETLSDEEKSDFIESYQAFNMKKQHLIESACQDLLPDLTETTASDPMTSLRDFYIFNLQDINTWIEATVQEVRSIIESHTADNQSRADSPLAKYAYVLQHIPLDYFVQVIASKLISSVLSSTTGSCTLTNLVLRCTSTLDRLISRSDYYPMAISSILRDDTVKIQISESILGILIDNSFLNEKDAMKYNLQEELKYDPDNWDSHSAVYDFNTADAMNGVKTSRNNVFQLLYERAQSSTHRSKIVRCHPFFLDKFRSFTSNNFSKELFLPMLTPPNPWVSPEQGGYLTGIRPFVLTNEVSTSMVVMRQAHQSNQLSSVYAALNQLGSLPWAINRSVLQVFKLSMKLRDGFLSIPPVMENIRAPIFMFPKKSSFSSEQEYSKEKRKYIQKYRLQMSKYYTDRSERTKYYEIEEIAGAFDMNGDSLYTPYGIDFRGRVYPLSTILHHYQEDLVRSLLMFWHSKPLGDNGYDWLKYQLAGVYGKDKLPFKERIAWVDENMEMILSLGESEDPTKQQERDSQEGLDYYSWWMQSDKHWQVLALCQEFAKINKYVKSGNSLVEYKCRIAIHQDGSCNGLQHYAALGLDYEGGKAVNLLPSEHREDIYNTVSKSVEQLIRRDISTGDNELAKLALPLLSRKVVKQTVMTSVYGVTRRGAFLQIQERIGEIIDTKIKTNSIHGEEKFYDMVDSNMKQVSQYLTKLTIESIETLFSKAKLIQDWLLLNCIFVIRSYDKESVAFKAKEKKSDGVPDFFDNKCYKPMMWTSLSGLPIIQPYKHAKIRNIKVSSGTLQLKVYEKVGNIHLLKQRNGIAPNFIHSIDSIHLQMTCLKAKSAGLDGFAAVHDSFWTYPKDVDCLNKIIREEFVKLHSSKIIESLRSDLLYTTRNSMQVCYVHRQHNAEFLDGLQELRKSKSLKNKKDINIVLYDDSKYLLSGNHTEKESDDVAEFKTTYFELLDRHKPDLYFKISSGSYVPYSEDATLKDIKKGYLGPRDYMPILVPVKILKAPPTGILDIKQVLRSEYFFS